MKAYICDKCGKVVKIDLDNMCRIKNLGDTIFLVKVLDRAKKQNGVSKDFHLCKRCYDKLLGFKLKEEAHPEK